MSDYYQYLLCIQAGKKDWCDHWKQCVWFIPDARILALKGQDISLRASHNDISISYDICPEANKGDSSNLKSYEERSIITLLPERIGLYGDKSWRQAFITAIKSAVSSPSFFVDKRRWK
jgi:type III protein arginine methyltransferase